MSDAPTSPDPTADITASPAAATRTANLKLFEHVRELRAAGQLPEARALLLEAGQWSDPHLVTQAVLVLNELEDSAGLHHALALAIGGLGDVARVGPDYLLFLHRRAEQHCLEEAARTPLFDMIAALVADGSVSPDSKLGRAWAGGQARRAFGAGFAARAARSGFVPNFIPLGLNCMPWVLTNRWGMSRADIYRRNLNPFSMAVHTIPGVIEALRSEFTHYAAPDEVMTIKAPGGRSVVMRQDRGATWVHHDNAFFVQDGYANLGHSMAERVAAMREACSAPAPVFMLNYVNVDYPNMALKFMPALRRALEVFTGTKDHYIFMSNPIRAHEGPQVYDVDPHACFFYCTLPEKGFEWNQENNLDSDKSMAFERLYVERIEECLRRWGLVGE